MTSRYRRDMSAPGLAPSLLVCPMQAPHLPDSGMGRRAGNALLGGAGEEGGAASGGKGGTS